MQAWQRVAIVILTVSFIYLFFLQIDAIWPFTIDDMYITLRYAKNWVGGLGLLWNSNELPVEGYSNFSFVLLGNMALMLGLNPVVILKTIGVAGLFLSCIGLYQLSRFWFLARLAIIPSLWLLAYKGEIEWSVSGLETTLYQAIILFSVVFIIKGLGYRAYPQPPGDYHTPSFINAGVLLAIAGLTRPEAPAVVALFACLLLFHRSKAQWPGLGKNAFIFCATFILLFSPYFVWRWHYFGRLFPNPVYCKGITGSFDWTLDKQYLHLVWPFFILAIPAIWKSCDKRHYFLWLPSLLYCVLLMGASPVVAFDNRLFLPAFALLLPLTLHGLSILLYSVTKRTDEVMDAWLYLAAFFLIVFAIPMMSLAGYRYFTQNPLAGERMRENVVSWLEGNTSPTDRVVLADSGLIPYRSKLNFTDSYCLNNAVMTQGSPVGMYQRLCKRVLKEKPEVIILTSLVHNGRIIYTPADNCLSKNLISNSDYQLQALLSTGNRDSLYRYEIYQIKPHI